MTLTEQAAELRRLLAARREASRRVLIAGDRPMLCEAERTRFLEAGRESEQACRAVHAALWDAAPALLAAAELALALAEYLPDTDLHDYDETPVSVGLIRRAREWAAGAEVESGEGQ